MDLQQLQHQSFSKIDLLSSCKLALIVILFFCSEILIIPSQKAIAQSLTDVLIRSNNESKKRLRQSNDVNFLTQEAIKNAEKAFQRGDYRMALLYYSEAIKMNPNSADLHYQKCLTRVRLGYTQYNSPMMGISDCSQAIKLNPRHDFAYAQRCSLLWDQQQVKEAIADCQSALKLNKNNTQAQQVLQNISYTMQLQENLEKCSRSPQCVQRVRQSNQPIQSDFDYPSVPIEEQPLDPWDTCGASYCTSWD